jgi:hypothetical protein
MSQRMKVRLGFSIILKQADCIDYSIVENLKFNNKNPKLEELPPIDKVLAQKCQNVRDYVAFLTKDEIKSLADDEVMVHIIFYPGNHEWHRVSDNIDSYLISENDALEGQIKYINSNLYPFSENKICLNNFKELPEHLSRQIFYKTQVDEELLALGFNNKQPLKEQFYMKAPLLIRNVARLLNFNDEQINQLRPTLVVYCS